MTKQKRNEQQRNFLLHANVLGTQRHEDGVQEAGTSNILTERSIRYSSPLIITKEIQMHFCAVKVKCMPRTELTWSTDYTVRVKKAKLPFAYVDVAYFHTSVRHELNYIVGYMHLRKLR